MQKENKIHRKTIRFTQAELNAIQQKADDEMLSFSQYITAAALNKKPHKNHPLFKELITQIAKVGNNINQIAKICNTEKSINKTIIGSLVTTIAELQTQLDTVAKKLHDDL